MTPDQTAENDPTQDEEGGAEEPTEAIQESGEEPIDGWGEDVSAEEDGPVASPMPTLGATLGVGFAGGLGQSPVMMEPKHSTPFDVAEADHAVPTSALWAMKYLRHGRYGLSSADDGPDRIRWASDEIGAAGAGEGSTAERLDEPGPETDPDDSAASEDATVTDETDEDEGVPVYVIDDGSEHCMVARLVGASPDGCTYALVARIKRVDFDDVRAGWSAAADLFTHGKEFTLCGVVEGSVSNVVRVAGYRRFKHVPDEYLPPSPFIEFDEAI
jgi:hypothetical protein